MDRKLYGIVAVISLLIAAAIHFFSEEGSLSFFRGFFLAIGLISVIRFLANKENS